MKALNARQTKNEALILVKEAELDNAALRLAATELYELVVDASKSAGIDPAYGPIERMANVLGIKTQGEGSE